MMANWYDADYVLKEVSKRTDEEFLFGKNSIHAKYTEFIKERDRLVEIENEQIRREQLRRAERRRAAAQAEISERC